MTKKVAFFAGLMAMSANSLAAYTCVGEVKGLSIEAASGAVLAEKLGPLSWPKLCSVTNEYNGIQPEACKLVFSTLLTAQVSGKNVRLWFNDEKDCTQESHIPWSALTGWYFGPKLE